MYSSATDQLADQPLRNPPLHPSCRPLDQRTTSPVYPLDRSLDPPSTAKEWSQRPAFLPARLSHKQQTNSRYLAGLKKVARNQQVCSVALKFLRKTLLRSTGSCGRVQHLFQQVGVQSPSSLETRQGHLQHLYLTCPWADRR